MYRKIFFGKQVTKKIKQYHNSSRLKASEWLLKTVAGSKQQQKIKKEVSDHSG